jgi:hypothetical protein
MGLLGRGNGGQHLGLIEQQRLIGIDRGSVLFLRDRAEVLRLDPVQLLLEQHHPLAVVSPFGPGFFEILLERLILSRALRGNTLGELQPSVQLGVLAQDLLR